MQPKVLKTKRPVQQIPKTLPKGAMQASKYIRQPQLVNKIKTSLTKSKTVAWEPNASKTDMMRKVRQSGVPASKKAGMIRQISQNKI